MSARSSSCSWTKESIIHGRICNGDHQRPQEGRLHGTACRPPWRTLGNGGLTPLSYRFLNLPFWSPPGSLAAEGRPCPAAAAGGKRKRGGHNEGQARMHCIRWIAVHVACTTTPHCDGSPAMQVRPAPVPKQLSPAPLRCRPPARRAAAGRSACGASSHACERSLEGAGGRVAVGQVMWGHWQALQRGRAEGKQMPSNSNSNVTSEPVINSPWSRSTTTTGTALHAY